MTDEQLVERAQHGDRAASRLLVERHLPLVRRLASRYRNLGLPDDDLVQEGSLGLLDAIQRFDRTRGAAFPTFAYWCARKQITHALTEKGHLLRLPKRLLERRTVIGAAAATVSARNGHEASVAELVDETGLPPADVREALHAPVALASLDELAGEGDLPLSAFVADEVAPDPAEEAVDRETHETIAAAIAELPANEQLVVRRHFGLDGAPEPLNDIAAEVGVSPQKARAIKDRALFHLARSLRPAAARTVRSKRRASSMAFQIGPLVAVLVSKIAALLEHGDVQPPL